jgi:O-glycosyl hydrolase
MRQAAARVVLGLLVGCLLVLGPRRPAVGQAVGPWTETRFQTGCDPGPFHPPPWPDPIETHRPQAGLPLSAQLTVELDPADDGRPILGSGFNLEHALWSCDEFRGLFRSALLDPFRPALVRVDSGLLPAAPPDLPAEQLGPEVYRSMLRSPQYAASWAFLRRLNQDGVRVVLGVWGGPPQFTDDGTRRGVLEPRHYDDYTTYVATLVEFLVRDEGVDVWAITIANEPDGGDGNRIPPDGLATIAHDLAERLAPLGVRLYGPDTSGAATALQYLPPLLDDPIVADALAFVAFHQYQPSPDVATVVDYVRARRPRLPVVVTEYTSFGFGDLDDGQDANDRLGYTLDVVNTLLAHYRAGVDAALYWDAVDYLQPGHDAVTKWGLLRGPTRDFSQRTRYYGMLQVLPYLGPGARVLPSRQVGADELGSLAVRTPSGQPAIILDNQGVDDVDLDLVLRGTGASELGPFSVWRTDLRHKAEPIGRLDVEEGAAGLVLPGRSLTSLFPAGASAVPIAPP